MALTGAQKVIFYESIGLSSAQVTHLVNQKLAFKRMSFLQEEIGGAVWFRQDASVLRAEIDVNLAALALDSDAEARLIVYLDQWEEIAASNLRVDSGGGAAGVLTDDPAERNLLEMRIANLTGVVMPSGGFYDAYMGLFSIGGGAGLR